MSMKDMLTTTQQNSSRDLTKLSAEDYLNRTKATGFMQDAVNLVLEYRPEQPLVFLARYFQMMCGDLNPIEISAYYIQSCGNITNPSFEDNIVLAYHALRKNNETIEIQWFHQLLYTLCEDISSTNSEKLIHHISPCDETQLTFSKFKHAIEICLLYGELISEGEDLFQSIDTANAKEIKQSVLLSALEIAITKSTTPPIELIVKLRNLLNSNKTEESQRMISLSQFLDFITILLIPSP